MAQIASTMDAISTTPDPPRTSACFAGSLSTKAKTALWAILGPQSCSATQTAASSIAAMGFDAVDDKCVIAAGAKRPPKKKKSAGGRI